MKKLIIAAFLFGFYFISSAQTAPKVGDILKINEPYAQTFNHVFFPKTNFLKKRGIISRYKSVYDAMVVVSEVQEKNGDTYVTLSKKDGTKFFNYLTEVKANYKNSIDSGELSLANN